MKQDLLNFLYDINNLPSDSNISLSYQDELDVELPVSFIRMVLLYGLDYINYYDDISSSSSLSSINTNKDSDTSMNNGTDSDTD